MYQNNFNGYSPLPQYQSTNPYAPNYGQNQALQTQIVPTTQIVKVNGENGARAYQMAQNSSVLLLDEAEPIVWVKTTDGAGFPTIVPYRIEKIENQPKQQENNINDEIIKRVEKLEKIIGDINNEQSNIKSNAD